MKKLLFSVFVIIFTIAVAIFVYTYFFSNPKLKILTVEEKFYNSSFALAYFNKVPKNVVTADGMNTSPTVGKITVNLINNAGCDIDVIMSIDGLSDNIIKSGVTYASYVGSNQSVINSALHAVDNYIAVIVCDKHSSSTDYGIEYQIQDKVYYTSGHLSYKVN